MEVTMIPTLHTTSVGGILCHIWVGRWADTVPVRVLVFGINALPDPCPPELLEVLEQLVRQYQSAQREGEGVDHGSR